MPFGSLIVGFQNGFSGLMSHMSGLLGILALLAFAWLLSRHKRSIDWRVIVNGLCLQVLIALFVLQVPAGQQLFHQFGQAFETLLSFSDQGAGFVFGPLITQPETMKKLFGPGGDFIFAFKLVPTIVFVSTLVSIGYHLGWIQRVVQVVAWVVYRLLGVSGSEAVSNVASIFVGQIEAQLLVRHYVPTMTQSELLAVMAGSLACIASGIMAVYIQMGIPAEYLLTASLMAVPGALVISKLVLPETEVSETRGKVSVEIDCKTVNLIDAAAHGASDGLRIGLTVTAMLIGFIALIGFADFLVGQLGLLLAQWNLSLAFAGLDVEALTLKSILGKLFEPIAGLLGVPWKDAQAVGALMGTKLVLNEFVAFADLQPQITKGLLDPKSIAVASIALCGFANFSSVAMQIGGIGEMAPTRKADLAKLGVLALLCGTMSSYVSAALAGILFSMQDTFTAENQIWVYGFMGLLVLVILVMNLLSAVFGQTIVEPAVIATDSPTVFKPIAISSPDVSVNDVEPLPTNEESTSVANEGYENVASSNDSESLAPPPLIPSALLVSSSVASSEVVRDYFELEAESFRINELGQSDTALGATADTNGAFSKTALVSDTKQPTRQPIWQASDSPSRMTPQFPPPFPYQSMNEPKVG